MARLKRERRALLEAGAGYSAGHPLVRRIDRALHEAKAKAQQAGARAGAVRAGVVEEEEEEGVV